MVWPVRCALTWNNQGKNGMNVSIIGTGYVGLTTGVCLASIGHKVTCVDILPERVASINRGEAPLYEPGLSELLRDVLSSGNFRASLSLEEAIVNSDVSFITVGTPPIDGKIDLSHVALVARQIGAVLKNLNRYHTVAVKSTVIPGTTGSIVRQILEETSNKKIGEFGLCMNPEFLREGCAVNDFLNPDRIVIGQADDKSGQVLAELYKVYKCPVIFTTLSNAEMIKYASNALLSTLISYSNEIASLCEITADTDVDIVMRGLHLDRRLSPVVNGQLVSPGILAFILPGCGFGGSCFSKDVNALRGYARDHGVSTHLLDAVMTINDNRPGQIVQLLEAAIGSLAGTSIAVLGLAFKPDTDDLRESPAIALIRLLLDKKVNVKAYDPVVKSLPAQMHLDKGLTICDTKEELLKGVDVAVLITSWPEFAQWDWIALCNSMRQKIIMDGRNFLRNVNWPKDVKYLTIGRLPFSCR
jgi:UDPglucose 6-dehydrogenase